MQQMPEVKELMGRLQREFNERFERALQNAIEIVKDRAPLYDTQLPVWYRVAFPEGFVHEIMKKTMRIQGETHREDFLTPEVWDKTREELLDIINYCGFAVAFGNMLLESQSTGRAEPKVVTETDFVADASDPWEPLVDTVVVEALPPSDFEIVDVQVEPKLHPETPGPKRKKLTLRRAKRE